MMKNWFVVLLLVLEGFGLLLALNRAETYDKSMTPRILTGWVSSRDGKLSACLVVNKTTFSAEDPISIRCALRNNTDRPLTILRPFGDPFYAHSSGVHIVGPKGEISYKGPILEYVLGMSSFLEIGPGMVIDETLELPKDLLPGLGQPGLYKIQYVYLSDGYPKKPIPYTFWEGRIEAGAVYILVSAFSTK